MPSSAQTYTLEILISHRNGWFWGNRSPFRKTHVQLTIRFPNTVLAQSLESHLRDLKYIGTSSKVFSGETVKVSGCDVTILLPTLAQWIQTNTHRIIIHFNTPDNARSWRSYFPSWFQPNILSSGQNANQLSFNYQQSYPQLQQTYGAQAPSHPQGARRQQQHRNRAAY